MLKLQPSDLILYSAKVIPGNDTRVMQVGGGGGALWSLDGRRVAVQKMVVACCRGVCCCQQRGWQQAQQVVSGDGGAKLAPAWWRLFLPAHPACLAPPCFYHPPCR